MVLLMVVGTGSATFAQQYQLVFLPVYLTVALYYFWRARRWRMVFDHNLRTLALFGGLTLVGGLANLDKQVYWAGWLVFAVNLLAAYLIIGNIRLKRFKQVFVPIVVALSVMSLLVYVMDQFSLLFPRGRAIFGYDMKIWLAHNCTTGRNAGIFWEPGIYQVPLNMAALFLCGDMLRGKRRGRWEPWALGVVILTLLSTRSTTGYLAFLVIAMTFIGLMGHGSRNAALWRALWGLAMVFIAGAILTSETVVGKFSLANYSFRARAAHVVGSLRMLLDYPLLGYGYQSQAYATAYIASTGRNAINSFGIAMIPLFFGLPTTLLYYGAFWQRIRRLKTLFPVFSLGLVLLLFFATEYLFAYPLGVVFLFRFENPRGPRRVPLTVR